MVRNSLYGSPRSTSTLERETGIEPATNSLEGCDSTTELLPPIPKLRPTVNRGGCHPALHARPCDATTGTNRKHGQHRQRSQLESLIVEGGPRQNRQYCVRAQRHPKPIHRETWCTGEDSNLRSSQGAADLQSAAINHSATCARSAELCARNRHSLLSKNPRAREPSAPSPAKLRNSRATMLARVLHWEAAAGFSSLGELRVSFGLLLLRLAARRLRSRFWSWRRDLNPRPSDYKSDALPAELRQPTS